MEPPPYFGFKELFTHIVGDMAKSVSERPNETRQQYLVRAQVAAQMIMSFLPRDVIEAMLAGHAVMFHSVLSDSVRDTLKGEMDTMRRATRSNLVALNKAFHMNIGKLDHCKARPSQGVREASGEVRPPARSASEAAADQSPARPMPKSPAYQSPVRPAPEAAAYQSPARPAPEAPAYQPVRPAPEAYQSSARPAPEAAAHQPPARPEAPASFAAYHPSAEEIAACEANPEAMAALQAGDAFRFARAMGIEHPSEDYLAAAAGLPADIEGKLPADPGQRPPNRQERRHPR